jgi:hypothetical protein
MDDLWDDEEEVPPPPKTIRTISSKEIEADLAQWMFNQKDKHGRAVPRTLTKETMRQIEQAIVYASSIAGPLKRIAEFEEADPLDVPSWLVPGILPRRGIGFLAGQWSAGKTFLALEFERLIVKGEDFRGQPVESGIAIHLVGEGYLAFKRRRSALGLPPELEKRIVAVEMRSLKTEDDATKMLAVIRAMKASLDRPVRLVTIDTLSVATRGADQNATTDMSLFMGLMQRIADELECCVLTVHHTGKDEARGMRGSTVLPADADFVLLAVRPPKGIGTLSVDKMRDAEPAGPIAYELDQVQLGPDPTGQPVTSCRIAWHARIEPPKPKTKEPKRTDNQILALDVIGQLVADGLATRRPADGMLDAPLVDMVKRNEARQLFCKRHPSAADKTPDALRVAFNRAVDKLATEKPVQLRAWDEGGTHWLWQC